MKKLLIKTSLIAIIAFLSLIGMVAQETTESPIQIVVAARKGSDTTRYLAVNKELKNKEKTFLASKRALSYLQILAISSSQIGEYKKALLYFDKSLALQNKINPIDPIAASELDKYKPQNAIKFIETIADSNQAIMLNEGHNLAYNRAFAIRLLDVLYKKGFRYFAAETLAENDKELEKRGYPIYGKTGFYTDEPVYGDLIRAALKIGYKVVAYESETGTAYLRERGQAQNLYDRILSKDPKAKIFVYAGYDHIAKGGEKDENKLMAQFFKDISKINPYSIDQVDMAERSSSENEFKTYKHALTKDMGKEPVVFCDKQGKPNIVDNVKYDAQIFHPRSEYQKGRPTWLLMGGLRKHYEFSVELCKGKFPSLVQAFLANEGKDAVPIDQVQVSDSKNVPALVLPVGEFRLRVVDDSGNIINESKIELK